MGCGASSSKEAVGHTGPGQATTSKPEKTVKTGEGGGDTAAAVAASGAGGAATNAVRADETAGNATAATSNGAASSSSSQAATADDEAAAIEAEIAKETDPKKRAALIAARDKAAKERAAAAAQEQKQKGAAAPAATAAADPAKSGEKQPAREKVGDAISTASTVLGVINSAGGAAVGAVAVKQPDGSYLLKDTVGPVSLTDPLTKSVLSKCVFGVSSLLKLTAAGVVLCTILEGCYKCYNSHASKPRWYGEFVLYLKRQESEILDTKEAGFKRLEFTNQLEMLLKRTLRKMQEIAARSTMSSLFFSGSDQEFLAATRIQIEKIKAAALQGMMTEIAEGGVLLKGELNAILATLEKQAAAGAGPSDALFLDELRRVNQGILLQQLLNPCEFLKDVRDKDEAFCPGTRVLVLREFERFATLKDLPPKPAKYDEYSERIFFLAGSPGSGKSTLAARMATSHATSMGAIHFCNHALSSRNDPLNIVKSILYQLCTRIPRFKSWFITQLTREPKASGGGGGGGELTLQKQLETNSIQNVHAFFKEFVVGGLCEVRAAAQQAKTEALAQGKSEQEAQQIAAAILPECVSAGTDGDVVVVGAAPKGSAAGDEQRVFTGGRPAQKLLILLDSLDESDQSTDDASSDDLVKILGDSSLLSKLPHWVGLVVTSRMENRIMRAMRPYCHFKLDTSSPENRVDLELYLRSQLRAIVRSEDLETAVQIILSKSEGMFLYAQCVLGIAPEHVSEVGVQLSLQQIRNFPEGLTDFFRVTLKRVRECFVMPGEGGADGSEDALPESAPQPRRQLSHRVITASVGTPEENAAARNFENVAALLRVVLAAREPLTIAQVACILGLSTAVVQAILLPMRSILPLRIDEQAAEGSSASSDDPAAAAASRAQSVQRVASSAPPDSAQILLFHKSLHDYLTDPLRNNTAEEAIYFVSLEEAHGLMHTMCLQQLFYKPELARSSANGKKQTQAQQIEELKKPFPLLRVPELMACQPGSLESYAVKYAVLHTLFVHDLTSLRFLLCSLQFVSLKIEFAQAGELLRQFNLALRRLEGRVTSQDLDTLTSPSGGSAASLNAHALPGKKRVLKEELHLFRAQKRFLQAEMRHLTHGFAEEAQSQLIFQYAHSYPAGHVAHAQANQPDLKPLWAGTQGLSVDYVLWLNQPLRLDAMIESWTELGPPLLAVAYHPIADACQLASTGADGSLSIWSTTTGEVERCFKRAHQGACTAVAYMLDGGMIATGGEDGMIHSWSGSQEGDRPLAVLPQPAGALDGADDVLPCVAAQDSADERLLSAKPGPITSLCFSSDENSGWIIAGSRDGNVYVWRKKTLTLKAVLESCSGAEAIAAGGVTGVAFSRNLNPPRRNSGGPDEPAVSKGFIVSTATDGLLRLWEFDLITGVATLPARSFHKHGAALDCLCISPDNSHVAVGTRDGSILLFDRLHPSKAARRFEHAHGHGHQGAVRCVDFSSNGQHLASGSTDETVRMWSVASGACLNVHAGHHLPVNAVRYSPSNHRLASVSSDESIRFWDAQLTADSHSHRALANQRTPADELKRRRCWNVTGVSFAGKDGSRIVTVSEDKLLRVWHAKDATVESVTDPLPFVPHQMIVGASFSEGSGSKHQPQQLVFLASKSSSDVVVLSLASGSQTPKICAQLNLAATGVLCMDVSADSKRLLVATSDNRVRMLNVDASGSLLVEAPGAQLADPLASTIRYVAFTDAAESSVIAVLDDDSAVIISGGAIVRKVARAGEGSAAGSNIVATVSPFGDRTLIASADAAGVVRVWDSSADADDDRRVVAAIQTACSGVHVIHWISAGSLFLATGLHQTFVWNFDGVAAGTVPFHFSGHDDTVTALASCGSRFVSGSLDNRVCVWETKHVGASSDALSSSSSSSSPPLAFSPSLDGSASSIPLCPPPRRSFLFESERASATGTTHLYECHSGAHRLRIGAKQ